jgi:manganese/iron transport system permease protein
MSLLLEMLLEPLAYPFFVRALMAAVLVGIVCAALGAFVVLRGMAFLGDALAHTILPGVVGAYLLGWPLTVGALLMGILTAVGIGALTSQTSLKEDTAIGVIFAGMFALGVAMLSASNNYSMDLAHFLFGNLLGVSAADLWVMGGLGGFVLFVLFLLYKEFVVLAFDPVLATALRLPTAFLNYLLLILMAVTIVVALQVVGIALMLAMLVTPAATASLLTKRLTTLIFTAALLGALAGLIGLYASYYLNIATGPAVVLVSTAAFVIAFVATRRPRP